MAKYSFCKTTGIHIAAGQEISCSCGEVGRGIYPIKTERIDTNGRISTDIIIEVSAAAEPNWVFLQEATWVGIVLSRPIVIESCFRIQLPSRKRVRLHEVSIQL